MTRKSKDAAEAVEVTVGDSIEIEGAGGLMVLPDYTVVTVRKTYTIRHEGEHKLIQGETAKGFVGVPVEADPEAPAEDGE